MSARSLRGRHEAHAASRMALLQGLDDDSDDEDHAYSSGRSRGPSGGSPAVSSSPSFRDKSPSFRDSPGRGASFRSQRQGHTPRRAPSFRTAKSTPRGSKATDAGRKKPRRLRPSGSLHGSTNSMHKLGDQHSSSRQLHNVSHHSMHSQYAEEVVDDEVVEEVSVSQRNLRPPGYDRVAVVGMQDTVVAGCALLSQEPRLVRLDLTNVTISDPALFKEAMTDWAETPNVVDLVLPCNDKGIGLGVNCFTSLRRLHMSHGSREGVSPRHQVRTSDIMVLLQQLVDVKQLRQLAFVNMPQPMDSCARSMAKLICNNARTLQVGLCSCARVCAYCVCVTHPRCVFSM